MVDTLTSQLVLSQLGSGTLDDALVSQEKQFLVFSSAGKPIYSFHGNEESLSNVMATAEALMSVVTAARSESLRYIRSGRYVVAFLDRSPLCLVAISTLAEPPAVLRMQLALVHGQLTSLLTASAMAAIFAKSPGYDARRLLGGADVMLHSLINSFSISPAALLGSFPSLALSTATRVLLIEALRTAMDSTRALFGLIVSAECVAALCAMGRQQLQQWDVLLVLNFLKSNVSLRRAETFTPICLPTYNPNGHLHAYIHYLDEETGTALVLLVGGANPNFQQLSRAQQNLVEALDLYGALDSLKESSKVSGTSGCPYTSLKSLHEPLQRSGIGTGCLLHCVFKQSSTQQFVATPWASLVAADEDLRRDIIVAYSQLRAAMFDHAGEHGLGPLQTLRYESRDKFTLVALSGPSSELYLVLDCLVGKAEAFKAVEEVYKCVNERREIFFF